MRPDRLIPQDPEDLAAEGRRYLQWMAERGFAESTIRKRETSLYRFLSWCEERGIHYPSELTRMVLELYQKRLSLDRKQDGTPLKMKTQREILSDIRAYCSWLARTKLVLYNPAADLVLPKTPKMLPRSVLTPAEVEQLFLVPDVSTYIGIRDRALLETLYSTGMRRAEVAKLTLSDLSFDSGTVLIRLGKYRKDRIIPIGERALAWVSKYVHEARLKLLVPPDDGVLFLTKYGKPYQPLGISERVSKLMKESGLRKKGSAHLLRHSMATAMLEGGADTRYIQQMLGHASLETTQVYTQVSIRHLKKVHASTHPAAKLKRRSGRERLKEESCEEETCLI